MYYTNENIHHHFVESMEQNKLTEEAIDILINMGQLINNKYHAHYMLETNMYGYVHLARNWNRVKLYKNATLTFMSNIYKNGLRDGVNRAQKDKKGWKRMFFIKKDDLYNKFGITKDMFNSVIELETYENDFYYFSYNKDYYDRWKKISILSSNDKLKKLIDLLDYCIEYNISKKEIFNIILKNNQRKFEFHSI